MINFIKALLFAGLFVFGASAAIFDTTVDYEGGEVPARLVTQTVCYGWDPVINQYDPSFPTFSLDGNASNSECTKQANKRYQSAYMSWYNKGRQCSSHVEGQLEAGWMIQDYSYQVTPTTSGCFKHGNPRAASVGSSVKTVKEVFVCPPEGPANKPFTKGPIENDDGQQFCYKPIKPLDCSKLKGLATNSQVDKFIANEGVYNSENRPSCVTKCGTDDSGYRRCSDCKVIAKSWINASTADGLTMWRPLVGTLTGASCGENEQETPPPEPPTCWQTQNNLKMCQQDPDEKCVTVNGARQCEPGCGFINNDFFCADKTDEPPTPPKPKTDKDLPEPDDDITDPEKTADQMLKSDFKDVQRGVESRLGVVSTGIGNLENSVDTGNQLLNSIKGTLEGASNIQNGILSELTRQGNVNGDGECDSDKEDCLPPGGTCDPNKQECEDFATGPRSWWTKKYPDGLEALFAEKEQKFLASDAYQAMQLSSNLPTGGTGPSWNFCVEVGSLGSFGCSDLTVPPIVWTFIRLCFLFGAAILCRRLIMGA